MRSKPMGHRSWCMGALSSWPGCADERDAGGTARNIAQRLKRMQAARTLVVVQLDDLDCIAEDEAAGGELGNLGDKVKMGR